MNFEPSLIKQAEEILELAKVKNIKIATAESCTGGLISAILTEIAGSSAVFERGFVTYSNQAKIDLLGVDAKTLEEFGAVSAGTAKEMAIGAVKNSLADLSVAVTGIAGPDGGTEDKPVGLVYVASFNRLNGKLICEECNFSKNRFQNRILAVTKALHVLTTQLLNV